MGTNDGAQVVLCKNQEALELLLKTLNKSEYDTVKITVVEPTTGSKGNTHFLVTYWKLPY